MGQIPLELRIEHHASLESFVPGTNAAALEHVRAIASGVRNEAVWLAGPSAVGKSHLLAGGCRAAAAAGLRSMYVALDPGLDPAMLRELDAVDVLALDDVHRAAGLPEWERALFVVLDARLHGPGGLLLAAEPVPRDAAFQLPDLVSRASAAAVYRLVALNDSDLATALERHARRLGFSIDEPAASFLLQRVSRDLGELTRWLKRIDRFALVQRRRITIPLLREVLAAAERESG